MKRKDGKLNKPGQGRPISPTTIFERTIRTIVERYPEITEEMINKALPQSLTFKCIKCKALNKIERVPGTGDREMLQHLDDRVMGKSTTNVNLNNKSQQLDNSQLSKLYILVLAYESEMKLVKLDDCIAEVKLIANPLNKATSSNDPFKNQESVPASSHDAMTHNVQFTKWNENTGQGEAKPGQHLSTFVNTGHHDQECKKEGGVGVSPERESNVLLVGSPSAEPKKLKVDTLHADEIETINFATGVVSKRDKTTGDKKHEPENWTAVEPEGDDVSKVEEKLKNRKKEIEAKTDEVEVGSWA